MEWERAKNILLIAFVILNLGLAGLLFLEDRRYTLSSDRVSHINMVLSENNINLYTTLMRRFAPMRHLDISGFYYDIDMLLEIFFEDVTDVVQEEAYLFTRGSQRLEISNGFISFDNNHNLGENRTAISRAEAIATAENFVMQHFPDFVRDIVFDEDRGIWVIYRQEYRGQLIYSNRIEIFVTSYGITLIDMQFGQVLGHGATPRMIFAPDEVLLTFMQRMRYYRAIHDPIFIVSMDMVYLQEFASDQPEQIYPAVPFYRIFIHDTDLPFLINAYTNVMTE
ncbi:MAG: hypothetical protein FWC89_00520 [Defluviitaleaceae bacterium]|nr:hypothetical protein [Defluviitaleaceae bacterium]